ncbi:MAG: sigma-54 dependent transcriptional regulator [Desulfomonilaceae bacterium]|nr:sigma-54 dependent transcriptional regulator [Desulfomonilaceae bacterium]
MSPGSRDYVPKVLVVDDEAFARRYFETVLVEDGYSCVTAESIEACTRHLEDEEPPDLIILDVRLPDGNGLDLLTQLQQQGNTTPIIVITAYGSVSEAVRAMKTGAFDFFTKPFEDPHRIKISIKNALEHRRLSDENLKLRTELHSRSLFRNLIGTSPGMQRVFELIRKAARTESHILIVGESGTGKELVAEAIHALSDRSAAAFIPINCAALPDTLLESSLFGYERGAFTGATKRTRGFLEEAKGGILFLDEIGDAALSVQAKILRVVEDGVIYRVGSTKSIRTDVRLIFATNKDLGREVSEGRFRKDLYFRINVIKIDLPPLRERREDIPLLARHFLAKKCADSGIKEAVLTDDALPFLLKRRWAGNVRELKNLMERIVALHTREVVTGADLARYSQEELIETVPFPMEVEYEKAKREFELAYFSRLLDAVGGDPVRVAERSRVHLSTVYRKLKSLGLSKK